jgi:hypothetical protein
MATTKYSIDSTTLHNYCALARTSIAPTSAKGKYYDGTTDIATQFAIAPAGSHLEAQNWNTYYYNDTAYAPLKLIKKGFAPHVETNLKRSGAKAYTLDHGSNAYRTYNIVRNSSNYVIKYFTGSSDTFSSSACVLEDFYRHSTSQNSGTTATSLTTISMDSGVSAPGRIYVEMCGAGGGGGGSSGSYASGGGGGAGSVSLILDLTEGDSWSVTMGPWGSGGARGNTSNCTAGSAGSYATITVRSSTEITSSNIYYYTYKSIVASGGGGGGRGGSANGSGGSGAGYPTAAYGICDYYFVRINNNVVCRTELISLSTGTVTTGYVRDTGLTGSVDGESVSTSIFENHAFYVLDYWGGGTGGTETADAGGKSPLSQTICSGITIASGSGTFAGGGKYGGGASGMGIGSVHSGADPGPGGGGNGRPKLWHLTSPGTAGFRGGTARCTFYCY